jgi:hypothetical protein
MKSLHYAAPDKFGEEPMTKSRTMWAVVFLAATNMAWAQDANKSAAPKAPAKTEQPATAAGGQSSGAVVGESTGTIAGVGVGTIAVVAGAVVAAALIANNTKSTSSH